jgi:hypothetical protein
MTTFMPIDQNGNAIPALRLKQSGAQTMSASTSASARNAVAFDPTTRVISLYSTSDIYVRFGTSGVTAASTDHFFPANTYYDFSIGGDRSAQYNYVAVLAASSAGTVYVSEKE